jgi:predicted SnoaL-like aldol condensation-catalyzing enzyme
LVLCCCAARQEPDSPRETLEAYARALEEGRVRDAYAMLTDEAKKSTPFEAFARMVKENPEEIREIVRALSRPASPPVVTAQVTTPDGDSLRLVYEDGAWRVDASAVDLYNQETPEAAVASFVRAFENKRYDVLMRFVPDGDREGLSATKLKQAFEGEQREEVERLTQALRAALPTARVERLGERATMSYGAGGTVELIREQGLWKIEGF